MIKKIHQIWFQGEKNVPSKYTKYINSVKNKNPDWEYKLYDESDLLKYAARYSKKCLDKMNKYKFMHQKIDLGRYLIAYFEGGITVDIDSQCVRSFNDLLKDPVVKENQIILSIANETDSCFSGIIAKIYIWLNSVEFVNNACIISPNNNSKILKDLVKYTINIPDCTDSDSSFACIDKTTGPISFSSFMKQQKSVGYIPFESITFDENNVEDIPGMYLIHHVQLSWITPFFKNLVLTYCRYNKFYILDILIISGVILLILLIILLIVKLLRHKKK